MTIISDIIKAGYRESNLIPITQTPTLAEQDEALSIFNRLVRSLLGDGVGDSFTTIAIGNNNVSSSTATFPATVPSGWYPPSNTRLAMNVTSAQTIYLSPNPRDGDRFAIIDASGNFATYNVTLHGNGRKIGGSNTATLSTNSVSREYFYRADLADWQLISTLTLVSDFPFPTEFEDLFIIWLALRINPRNGAALDEQSITEYRRLKSAFTARYQTIKQGVSELGLLNLAQSPAFTSYSRASDEFNRGFW